MSSEWPDSDSDDPPPPTAHQIVDERVLNDIPTRSRHGGARQRWGKILKEAEHVSGTPVSTVQWLFGQMRRNKEERSEIDLLKSMGLRHGDNSHDTGDFGPAPPPLPPRPSNLVPIHQRRPPPRPPKRKKGSAATEAGSPNTTDSDETPTSSVPTAGENALYSGDEPYEMVDTVDEVEEATTMRMRMQAIEEMKAASEIFTLYIKKGALREIGLSNVIKSEIQKKLEAGTVSGDMFDKAQRNIMSLLRTDMLPKYFEYVDSSTNECSDAKLAEILSDEVQSTAFVDYCTSMYTEENVLFYLAVEKFRRLRLHHHESVVSPPPVPSPPIPPTPTAYYANENDVGGSGDADGEVVVGTPTRARSVSMKMEDTFDVETTKVPQAQMSEADRLAEAKERLRQHMLTWPTIKQLVVRMISASHENVDFRNSFLLTMHYFSSPPEVLTILFERLALPPPKRDTGGGTCGSSVLTKSRSRESLSSPELTSWKASKIRVFSVLKHWVKMYASDFDSPLMETHLRNTLRQFPPLEWSHLGYNTGTLKVIAQSVLDALENTRSMAIKKKQNKRGTRTSYAHSTAVVDNSAQASPRSDSSRDHWIPDQVTNACMVCWSAFTFINRRHHCRNCGILVCGSCSSNSAHVDDPSSPSSKKDSTSNTTKKSAPSSSSPAKDYSKATLTQGLKDFSESTAKLLRLGSKKKKKVRVCDNCFELYYAADGASCEDGEKKSSDRKPLKKNTSKVKLQAAKDRATAMHNVLAKSLQENRSVDILKISAQAMAFQLTLIAKRRMQDINGPRDFMKTSTKWIKKLEESNSFKKVHAFTASKNLSSASNRPPARPKLPPSSRGRVANMRAAFERSSATPPPIVPPGKRASASTKKPAISAQAANPMSRLTTVHDSISLAINRTVDRLRPAEGDNADNEATVSMDGDLFANIKNKAQRQWQMRMSNQMSCWVASEILNTREELRPRMFQRWIKVANICYELRNFNTLFEIMTGLSHNSVYRLKNLTESLPNSMYATYEQLCKIVHYNSNYATYRLEVAEAASHGKSVIPYLGVMLRDLVAIEEGGAVVHEVSIAPEAMDADVDHIDVLSGKPMRKHVNFPKLQTLSRLVTEALNCQHATYNEVKPDTTLQLRLLAGMIQALDEEELLESSYKIKAPKYKINTAAK